MFILISIYLVTCDFNFFCNLLVFSNIFMGNTFVKQKRSLKKKKTKIRMLIVLLSGQSSAVHRDWGLWPSPEQILHPPCHSTDLNPGDYFPCVRAFLPWPWCWPSAFSVGTETLPALTSSHASLSPSTAGSRLWSCQPPAGRAQPSVGTDYKISDSQRKWVFHAEGQDEETTFLSVFPIEGHRLSLMWGGHRLVSKSDR